MAPADPELTLGAADRIDPAARVVLTGGSRPEAYALLRRLPAEVLVWRRYPAAAGSSGRAGCTCSPASSPGWCLPQAAFGSAAEVARFPAPVYAAAR